MMIMDYVGFADRTAVPVKSKIKTRGKADWGWKPYRKGQLGHGPIKLFRPIAGVLTKVRTIKAGRPKLEERG